MASTSAKTSHPTYDQLKTRIDDLRVRVHLGGMDAQDKLEELSHELTAWGKKAKQLTKEAAVKLHDRLEALEAALIIHD